MRKNTKKAQMITFDLSTSLIIFIIFIAIFIGLFLMAQKPAEKPEFELEYIFANLEHNLIYDAVADPTSNRDFIRDYRVNYLRLNNFATDIADIDPYVLGNIGDAHGIGLDEEAYDACMYFTDNDNQILSLSGKDAVGMLRGVEDCNDKISSNQNPCDGYKKAYALFRPVLLLQGNPDQNRIILMNIVMCKK